MGDSFKNAFKPNRINQISKKTDSKKRKNQDYYFKPLNVFLSGKLSNGNLIFGCFLGAHLFRFCLKFTSVMLT